MAANSPGDLLRRSQAGRVHSPSRERVLKFVEAAGEPVDLASIARRCEIHENTARAHLEALVADGYLVRAAGQSTGRGRPPWLWSAPRRVANPYAGLARALARQVVAGSREPVTDAISAGREWGRALARDYVIEPREDAEVATAVGGVLDAMGFDPQPADSSGRISLHACPILEAAEEYPQVVCNVHLGIIRGVLQELGQDELDTSLIPFKSPGCCELQLGADRGDEK